MGGLLTATRAKISSSNLILRDQHFNRISNASSKRESFLLEPLENRLLLSVGLVGIPDWVPEGPAPQISAGNVIGTSLAEQKDVGAVNELAVDPNNSKHTCQATTRAGCTAR